MTVLLLGPSGTPGDRLIARLVAQDDDVRVVEPDHAAAPRWGSMGAHVARGSPLDEDLLARAARGVRTVVVLEHSGLDLTGVVAAVRAAAASLNHDIRVVLCTREVGAEVVEALSSSGAEYVLLRRSPVKRWSRRARVKADDALAEAIDAADDLSGAPHLVLDLALPESWDALGVAPP
jgi:uncharacterized protein YbjT (DUF2867 family)